MQSIVYEITNHEYIKKFDYFLLRTCLYKTIVYTLVNKYGTQCRRSNIVIEDSAMNKLYYECLSTDNVDFIYEALANKAESEVIVNLMPTIEIYLDRLFFTKYLFNKCIVITANTVSSLTTQILFKILR